MAQEITGVEVVKNPQPLRRLHSITDWSNFAYIESILKEHPEEVSITDDKGNLPLHHAARFAEPTILKRILDAYPKGIFRKNNDGCNPLHLAIASYRGTALHPDPNDVHIVERCKMLLDVSLIESITFKGDTPLRLAIEHQVFEVVRLLFEHGADLSGVRLDDSPSSFLSEIPDWVFDCLDVNARFVCKRTDAGICRPGLLNHFTCAWNWICANPEACVTTERFRFVYQMNQIAIVQILLAKRKVRYMDKVEGLQFAVALNRKVLARVIMNHLSMRCNATLDSLMSRGSLIPLWAREMAEACDFVVPGIASNKSFNLKQDSCDTNAEKRIDTKPNLTNNNAETKNVTNPTLVAPQVSRAMKLAAFNAHGREELLRYWTETIDAALHKAAYEDHVDYVQLEIKGDNIRNHLVKHYKTAGFYAYNNTDKMRITFSFFDDEKK